MNIVLLTKENKNIRSSRINLDFISKLSNYCDEFCVIPAYNGKSKKLLVYPNDIYNEYKPDVVICHAHSKFLKGFFKKIPCLKVMIAVDFWKLIKKNNMDFYKSNNFDIVFHRGYGQKEYKKKMISPSVWLPWSASEKDFFPKKKEDRKSSVGFVGTSHSKSYKIRNDAIKRLLKEKFFKFYGVNTKRYTEILRNHRSMLSSAELGSAHAKLFEIMASGTIPLINNFGGSDILFNSKCYVEFKDDMSDIIEKASISIEDDDLFDEISINARNEILDKHTDDIRIKELYINIKNMLEGKKIERKWE